MKHLLQTKYNKYKNIRIGSYASKKEHRRAQTLKMLENKKIIHSLKEHPRYKINVNKLHICDYIADFEYINKDGEKIVEDVKGMQKGLPYQIFQIKRRLMQATNNIIITEII